MSFSSNQTIPLHLALKFPLLLLLALHQSPHVLPRLFQLSPGLVPEDVLEEHDEYT